MTEEDFLTRWSRRKREIAKAEEEPRAEKAAPENHPEPDPRQPAEPEFDMASLPPIESINALTDVTQFLRVGVPADLVRAALRRVWTADPAIRDFVGLAENAWDFTDPTAMPGFGPLESTDEVRRMIANLVDQIGEAARPNVHVVEIAEQDANDRNAPAETGGGDSPVKVSPPPGLAPETVSEYSGEQVLLRSSKVDTAPQHDAAEDQSESQQLSRRSHGGALPQ